MSVESIQAVVVLSTVFVVMVCTGLYMFRPSRFGNTFRLALAIVGVANVFYLVVSPTMVTLQAFASAFPLAMLIPGAKRGIALLIVGVGTVFIELITGGELIGSALLLAMLPIGAAAIMHYGDTDI